jgi:acyl-coenzyme A thioesterase PaaI-like protein
VALSLTPPASATAPVRSDRAPVPGSVLPPHYASCFGCGDEHPTGLHLSVTVREGVAVDALFRVAEAHQGAPGLAHGGVLATAADETLGFLNWLLRRPAVTARLEVDYVRPVPIGSDLYLRAECTAVAGRKAYVRCEGHLDAPDGPVALRAAGLFLEVSMEHFRKHAPEPQEPVDDERSYNP